MKRQTIKKLRVQRGAISRMVAVMLVLVAVMVVVVSIPTIRWCYDIAERHACEAGMDTAWRQMTNDYIINGTRKVEDVKKAVGYAMNGWDDICPGGGKVYLITTGNNNEDKNVNYQRGEAQLPYRLVCGKHDKDEKLRTRLNADDLLWQIKNQLFELNKRQKKGVAYPETLTLTYNSKPIEAVLVDENQRLKRGTATTSGLEKEEAVVYYSIAGHSDFGKDSGAKEGEVWYFAFADKKHCANWRSDDGWTGDSYEGL